MNMKKWISMFFLCTLFGTLTACSSGDAAEEPEQEQTEASGQESEQNEISGQEPAQTETSTSGQEKADAKESETEPESGEGNQPEGEGSQALVVYFSWSGNTENVANSIAAQTGADMFRIVPSEPYVDDYNELLDIASEEKRNGARPEIADSMEDLGQYDVIYVGFPNWWGDMPMILYSFFDSYDLSGKTVAPFCTSGGSGLSDTVNSIKALEPEAEVLEGLHISGSAASDPDSAVGEWLDRLGL